MRRSYYYNSVVIGYYWIILQTKTIDQSIHWSIDRSSVMMRKQVEAAQ
jgi:hypothetical protein